MVVTPNTLRMPVAPTAALPIPRIGRLLRLSAVTLWPNSPLSVLSSGAASFTVTDSPVEPTSRLTSMRNVCSTGTRMFGRTYFLKPCTVTETSYVPVGTCTT